MTRRRTETLVAVGAVLLALTPLIVAIAQWTGRHWLPIHDVAVTDMRVRDVFTSDTPLVGPYSRYLWNHPGPVLFWMMAIPSLVSGHAAWGTLVGGILVQAIAVIWAGALAWRVGRAPAVVITMAVVLLTYRAIGPLAVLEPWNPHIALPWFVLFVLYAWRLAVGELNRLVGGFFIASFLVQTHIGYLPLVLAAVVVIGAYRVVDRRRGTAVPIGWRTPTLTAALAAVLWMPVVIEQFRDHPGNLTRLSDYFLGAKGAGPTAGLHAALGLFGSMFTVPPSWLGGREVHDYLTDAIQPRHATLMVVPIALLAVGYVGARAVGSREHSRYVVTMAAMVAAGLLALSRVTGDLLAYLFYWRIPLALGVIVAGGVGVADLVSRRAATGEVARRASLVVGLIALLVVSLDTTVAVATHGHHVKPFEVYAQQIVDQMDENEIAPGDLAGQTVLVRFEGSTIGGLQGGVVDALDRAGVRVRVDDDLGFQFGDHRAATVDEVDQVWYALEDGVLTSIRTSDPNGHTVARIMPLGPDVEAEMVQLQLTLRDELRAAGRLDLQPTLDSDLVTFALRDVPGVDLAAAGRLGDLNAELRQTGSCRCSIVAYAADDAGPPATG